MRIDLSAALAQLVVIPALDGFLKRYPDIQIEIGASDRPADLVAENVDCVIRGGLLSDPTLIARRIAELHMITCAAPAYLDRHGEPEHPAALEHEHWVVAYFSAGAARPRMFVFARASERLELHGRYRAAVNEAATYLTAGLAGHGIMQVPVFMARPHLLAGRLRRVLPEWSVASLPLYIVYPPNRHLSNKLRVFVDWVAGLFSTPRFALEASPASGNVAER